MTTSGTYAYSPSAGELGLTAFRRIGVHGHELTSQHMSELRNAANLLLAEWSNQTPNLWEVGLQTQALTAGTATYSVNANTVMMLDVYVTYGSGTTTDRILMPISRTEYASYPNKTQQGVPTVFWFNRIIAPTFTLYPVPDNTFSYTVNYYSVRQTQDVNVSGADTPEIPYRFLDAFTAGLAWKLAEIFRPELEDKLYARYMRAWGIAATQDTEGVPLYLTPGLSGYWRV